MNIHIDEKTYKELLKSVLIKIEVGSSLFGLKNKKSDTDFLYIVTKSKAEESSFNWSHHNLQYKDGKIDHIFTSIQNFIRNMITGDSTINYEALFSEEFQSNKELSFIMDFRKDFRSYSLLRSYLGLAKRDINQYSKTKDLNKLTHCMRGYWSFLRLLENDYTNDIKSKDREFYDLLVLVKNNSKTKEELEEIRKEYAEKIASARKKLSLSFQKKEISRTMSHERIQELDSLLIDFSRTEFYKSRQTDFICEGYYLTLEKDVEY